MEKQCKLSVMVICLMLVSTIMSFHLSFNSNLYAEDMVSYALSWVDNPNIPYVLGGGRAQGTTLESLAQDSSSGTDCSGFVSLVYAHFGITIPAQSSAIYDSAVNVFYDQAEAKPGDICWWQGHVALYIGNNKIVHTNTSKVPNNLIHVSELGVNYHNPSAYLRMTNDVTLYTVAPVSPETEEQVINAVCTGTLVTESDLDGMPILSTLLEEQKRITLKSREDMTQQDLANLEYIASCLAAQKVTPVDWYHRLMSFLGLGLMVYGVLMVVCYLVDYTNSFIDISLLSVISMGRWQMVSKYEIEEGLVKAGRNPNGITYLTASTLAIRSAIIVLIGVFLVSGKMNEIISGLLQFAFSKL